MLFFVKKGTDRPQLRLILKVGGSSTPEADNSDGSLNRQVTPYVAYGVEEESRQSSHYSYSEGGEREKHKKKKEKKKKKNKDKDKDRDKDRKKHKHKVFARHTLFSLMMTKWFLLSG